MANANISARVRRRTNPRLNLCNHLARKYRLTTVHPPTYPDCIAETTATRFGDLRCKRRTAALERFFYVRAPCTSTSMGGSGGKTFVSAGFLLRRFANPAICRSPHLAMESGSAKQKELAMPTNTPARSEQMQSPIFDIARTAVRSAALAPSDSAALDAAGGALAQIAAIARAERRGGSPGHVARADLHSPDQAASAFQRIHYLLVLVDGALQFGALDQQLAADLLKDAMKLARLNGEALARNESAKKRVAEIIGRPGIDHE